MALSQKIFIVWKNHKYEKCSKSSKLFEKIIFRQKFLDLTHKRNTVYFSCKNTKFYGLTSKSKGFLQKAPRTWYIVRKWDFMVKRQKVRFLISILTPQNDSSRIRIFSWFLLQMWPLQQISGLLKIYMICSNMMFRFIFIMFWVPKTLYYSIMYI